MSEILTPIPFEASELEGRLFDLEKARRDRMAQEAGDKSLLLACLKDRIGMQKYNGDMEGLGQYTFMSTRRDQEAQADGVIRKLIYNEVEYRGTRAVGLVVHEVIDKTPYSYYLSLEPDTGCTKVDIRRYWRKIGESVELSGQEVAAVVSFAIEPEENAAAFISVLDCLRGRAESLGEHDVIPIN